ncbi:calcium-binding protein [Phaeobacter inhibens]|uniref:calcium-binding protein n=1 Tax=Phaeobacter inhibens TaxID=221822 RepID=UPI000CA0D634|nr:hypothetical protein [Phaeobacter inhibens]AUQ66364.1 RTX toxin [Phaeobacter inhibens]
MSEFMTEAGNGAAVFNTSAALHLCADGFATADNDAGVADKGFLDLGGSHHSVYNFEVEGTHTYVADGIRVHNTSVLSFLTPGETIVSDTLKDRDGDGDLDYYIATVDGGFGTVEVTSRNGTNEDTTIVTKDYEYQRDGGRIQLVQEDTVYRDPDTGKESVSSVVKHVDLDGMHIGEKAAQALTPFLARALIGDGASFLETVATNTILDTVLGNFGELAGGVIHSSFLEASTNGDVIEAIAKTSFQDFGAELAQNGISSVTSAVNSLIMAEIFEAIEIDGVAGAIFQSVTSTGLNVLISQGTDKLLGELFGNLPDGNFLNTLSKNYEPTSFENAFANPVSLIATAVINQVLPNLETTEGTIASSLANALVLANLGQAGGPIGAVVGFLVGKVFDALFDKDPQAWTNVGYNKDTGRFEITGTWQDDGGNVELSKNLAQAYVDGMNSFVDTVMSQSNNFDELGRWSFGHYEDMISNLGSGGRKFADMEAAYINSLVNDLGDAELNDGQFAAVRALNSIPVADHVEDYKLFANFKTLINEYRTSGFDISKADLSNIQLDFEETLSYHATALSSVVRGNPPSYEQASNFRSFLEAWHSYLAPIQYTYWRQNGDGGDHDTAMAQSPEAESLRGIIEFLLNNYDFDTLGEFVDSASYQTPSDRVSIMQAQPEKWGALNDVLNAYKTTQDWEGARADNLALVFFEPASSIKTNRGAAPEWDADTSFRDFLTTWSHYLGPVRYSRVRHNSGGEYTEWVVSNSSEAQHLKATVDHWLKFSFETLEEFISVTDRQRPPAPTVVYDNFELYQLVMANLQIANDYHTYLENTEEINTLITTAPNSNLAAGWVATLSEAKEMGLADPYDLRGDAIDNVFYTADGADTVWGEAGDDLIKTYGDKDQIQGGTGDDTIYGGSGDDTLWGGEGNDSLFGDAGNDVMRGADGADYMAGNDGNDHLAGGIGNDSLYGGTGDDTLHGNEGDDLLTDDSGANVFNGGSGDDTVSYYGHSSGVMVNLETGANSTGDTYTDIESLIGSNAGGDTLTGDAGDNTLEGGGGNDHLNGGKGRDRFNGGSGTDRVYYSGATTGVTADLQVASANTGEAAGDTYVSIERLSGSAFGDRLLGDDATNALWGENGNDTLTGRAGNDTLYGGAGNDKLYGGSGRDKLDGGTGSDTVYYSDAGSGVIANLSSSSANTGEAAGDTYVSIEHLYGSGHADTLSGTNGANTLWGANGNDQMRGLAGNDTLYGGSGNDTLFGGAGSDRLDGGSGVDLVSYADETSALRVYLANSSSNSGSAAGDVLISIEGVTGTNYGDYIKGSSSSNTLSGGNGNDSINGDGGNDTIYGGNHRDLLVGGSGNDQLFGGYGHDTLRGGSGVDILKGGAGNDSLRGETGNDNLTGDAGNDTFVFGKNFDRDQINDFQNNIDTIELRGFGLSSVSDAMSHAYQSGSRVVFDFGSGDKLVVLDTNLAALQDDIIFVG